MIALTITRVLVIVILWSSIQEVHTNGPQLNTLFVDIGQLYPRADFAGVLIDLNVDQAIARGKAALNLTDYFLQHSYNKPKQIIGKWTGANRNIHFLALKRKQVEHNLHILTTDLYQITEQYRIPGFKKQAKPNPKHKPNPRPTNRHKRGINFDIEFDVNKALNMNAINDGFQRDMCDV